MRRNAVYDFFPGLFRNETFITVGHGVAQGARVTCRALCRTAELLYRQRWTARWSFLALTGLLMWGLYCGPNLTVYELAARHPDEIAAVRGTVTVFGKTARNLNGAWDERSVVWKAKAPAFAPVMDAAETLTFRRFIGEPLARLTPDRDGVSASGLTDGDRTLRLEFLDESGHAYFTLLCYPDTCYYAKDGLGSSHKFLPVALKTPDGAAALCTALFPPGG